VIPLFLSKSRTFWAYRLKQEGIVLQGDRNILKKIRAKKDNISRIEAIRILFQTLVVWVLLAELNNIKNNQKENLLTVLRAYLNMGESYLTFFGCLRPCYAERAEEFKKRWQEFGLERDLAEKIILGYSTKTNSQKIQGQYESYGFSLAQARRDCLKTVNCFLSFYLAKEGALDEKIEILSRRIKPNWLFNFFFFWFLKKLQKIRPRFFPIVFKFKITDLWKVVIFNASGEKEKLFNILRKYFKIEGFTDETLVKIFEAHPSLSTVEIT